MSEHEEAVHPGQTLGLPAAGPGSLAPWGARIAALLLDWGASMGVAVGLFGTGVLTEGGWRAWMTLAVFFVETSVLTALAGGSFGKIVAGIGVLRLDGGPPGWGRSVARSALVCLVVPAIVIGAERRTLADLVVQTVVVRRR